MKNPLRSSLAIGFSAFALSFPDMQAHAQQTLEIVPLRHRSADQVIPVLRPLLETGGVISGQGYQLILRTSPRNLEDLKATLAAIDSPQRRLQISVRFDEAGERRAAGVVSTRTDGVDQRLQVLEGARAFISTGRSRPLQQSTISTGPSRTVITTGTTIQELATGFEVVPRVSGDQVFLEIHSRRDRARGSASVDTQEVASTVSGRLGEWIDLGGSVGSFARSERGVLSGTSADGSSDRRVWIMLEEVQRELQR